MYQKLMLFFFLSGSFSHLYGKHLFVFDFAQTLTKTNTYKHTHDGNINLEKLKKNVKPQVAETLRYLIDRDFLVGIATFHTISGFIRTFLKLNLPLKYVQKIKIVVRQKGRWVSNHKNNYIKLLIRAFMLEGNQISGVTFYDNNIRIINDFRKFYKNYYTNNQGTEGVLVNSNPLSIGHFSHAIQKANRILETRKKLK